MKKQFFIAAIVTAILPPLSYDASAQSPEQADKKAVTYESPYNSNNRLGISGIDLGLRLGTFNISPHDPYTGKSLLTGYNGSPTKPILQVSMLTISTQVYWSILGSVLLKKKDRKWLIADISEIGVDIGKATEKGKYFDGTDIHSLTGKAGPNNTVGAFANVATGLLLAHKINKDMRVSIRYQYLIDQGVVFNSWLELDKPRNFDLSRKRITGTFSYKEYMVDANVGIGWKYGGDKHGNNGWGIGMSKRVGGANNHLGLQLNIVHHRKSEGDQESTRNWNNIMLYYGVGI